MAKRKWVYGMIVLGACWWPAGQLRAQDPIWAIISSGVGRIIRAFDLRVQRLQTNTIWLQEAQKKLENAMQALHLDEIRDWIQDLKELYGAYFQELWQVKAVITDYYRVKQIIDKQQQLVVAYRRVWSRLREDDHFSAAERVHMEEVYAGILDACARELDLVLSVIRDLALQMSDGDRMEVINRAEAGVDDRYRELLRFNQENVLLSLQRAASQQEVEQLKRLYGVE